MGYAPCHRRSMEAISHRDYASLRFLTAYALILNMGEICFSSLRAELNLQSKICRNSLSFSLSPSPHLEDEVFSKKKILSERVCIP